MSLAALTFSRSWSIPQKSVAFGTPINALIPPAGGQGEVGNKNPKMKTKVGYFKYTAGTTAHTLTFLKALAKTFIYQAALAGATTFVINRDPGNYSTNALADGRPFVPSVANNLIASGDNYAIHLPDGTWFVDVVSAATTNANGTVTITPTATIPAGGIAANAVFFWFGITTDTNPGDGATHPQFTAPVSATTIFDGSGGEIVSGIAAGDPILFSSNNVTATGTLNWLSGFYGI